MPSVPWQVAAGFAFAAGALVCLAAGLKLARKVGLLT